MTYRTENWIIDVSAPITPNVEKGELIQVKIVPRDAISALEEELREKTALGNILDLNSGHVVLCNSKLDEDKQLVLLIQEQIIE